ncbi:MAG: TetR/AcrR family transcriptional regulator [Gammaproteobacteria bacterium]|nr:TetR/AcrR family transcriptional regulator [Gammaproteobacteria bacterium]
MPNTAVQDQGNLPKMPLQRRGHQRVARILGAAEDILRESGVPGVTAHAVAKRAGVPPSSVYQFFPTPNAILFALAQSLMSRVQPYFDEALAGATIREWPDIIRTIALVGQHFYRDVPHAAPLIIGSYRTSDIYATDKNFNERMAHQVLETFAHFFQLPAIDKLEQKLLVMVEIADAVWAISVRLHGVITDEFNMEAQRAMIGYLSNYLPPVLPRRQAKPPRK